MAFRTFRSIVKNRIVDDCGDGPLGFGIMNDPVSGLLFVIGIPGLTRNPAVQRWMSAFAKVKSVHDSRSRAADSMLAPFVSGEQQYSFAYDCL